MRTGSLALRIVSAHMANSPTLHTVPARPSSRAPHTLRTRSAHALHSRAGSQPARLRGQPLARLTQLMRGPAGTSLRQIKCTLGTALPRRAPPLSLSRSLRLHCTRAAVWRREAAADAQRACPSASLPNGRRQGGRRRPAPAISTAAAAIATMAFRAVGTLHRDGGGQAGQVV